MTLVDLSKINKDVESVQKAVRHVIYQTMEEHGRKVMIRTRNEMGKSNITLRNTFLKSSLRYQFDKKKLEVGIGLLADVTFADALQKESFTQMAHKNWLFIPNRSGLKVTEKSRQVFPGKKKHWAYLLDHDPNVYIFKPDKKHKFPFVGRVTTRGRNKDKVVLLYFMQPRTEHVQHMDMDKLVSKAIKMAPLEFSHVFQTYWRKKFLWK